MKSPLPLPLACTHSDAVPRLLALAAMADTYVGGCHCGRVRFRVSAQLTGLLVCNCSMCTKKGIWHWIVEQAAFELLSGAEELLTYRFGSGVAQHQFCRHCGIHAFYTPRSDPDKVDVNARCLDGVDLEALSHQLTPFPGQNWEAAQAERRAK
jgi:hypothetical protein